MTVIAAKLYREGKFVRDAELGTKMERAPRGSEFYWIGLFEPDEAELAALQTKFKLHPLAIEDAGKAHQLPKLDIYGDQIFALLRTISLDDDEIVYGETAIFVGKHHIITVRHGSARAHTELRNQLESSPALLKHGIDYVLHAVLDYVVDGYQPVIDEIEERVHAMEHRALDTFLKREDVREVFSLRRQLSRLQRIMGHTSELCARLANVDLPNIDAEVRPYFRDVLDHVLRVEGRVANTIDTLTSVFEVSMLLEQQQQGNITRQLASWAAILAVPTAIAGIYGMNFENMPELKTANGYFIVIGVIVAVCVALFIRFKRAGWL